jgi:FMN phosphatase YigB (HAD superfamily)
MNSSSVRFVVFDLGGVLVRVTRDWPEAARAAGMVLPVGVLDRPGLEIFPEFIAYQAGTLPLEPYLAELARQAGCDRDQALHLHQCILLDPYPRMEELVEEIERAGLETGCLSNTNAAHWDLLIDANRYPAIARLTHKMASHLEGLNKPDPEIFRRYAQRHGALPAEIAFFDDNATNVESARSVGLQAHLIDPFGDPREAVRRHLVDLGALPEEQIA